MCPPESFQLSPKVNTAVPEWLFLSRQSPSKHCRPLVSAILFASRGYLNTGDKAVAGALIFVALVAIGTEAIIHFLGP